MCSNSATSAHTVTAVSRRHKLKWFQDCFRGSDAVTWLVEAGGAGSREEAVEVGCEMMELGLIYHVTHRHGFSDKSYRLYR